MVFLGAFYILQSWVWWKECFSYYHQVEKSRKWNPYSCLLLCVSYHRIWISECISFKYSSCNSYVRLIQSVGIILQCEANSWVKSSKYTFMVLPMVPPRNNYNVLLNGSVFQLPLNQNASQRQMSILLIPFKEIIPFQSIFSGLIEMRVMRIVLRSVPGVCWLHDVKYLGMAVRPVQGCWSQSFWKFITKVPESHEPQIWEKTMSRMGDIISFICIYFMLAFHVMRYLPPLYLPLQA